MIITSPSFAHGAILPFSCGYESENRSPALSWADIPAGVESLALVCEDQGTEAAQAWTHWLIWNIDPCETGLAAALPPYPHFVNGTEQGFNDYLEVGWGGPCPPTGVHTYTFTLYALDTKLQLAARNRQAFDVAIGGHVVASVSMDGVFQAENLLVSYQKARSGRTIWN
ncbi:MAG: YbhB/YbcL family Raf kinase inhibitor-like protein [Spirochaetes bacterium]|nr:YbhB/YbcL family Raf kinase inhibitor-like protein [Spirochaetota bacterium]MBU0954858.1 YbhB/YbcL family Raf kinase inhibitor-like protein [Spirochaetota bacterium]